MNRCRVPFIIQRSPSLLSPRSLFTRLADTLRRSAIWNLRMDHSMNQYSLDEVRDLAGTRAIPSAMQAILKAFYECGAAAHKIGGRQGVNVNLVEVPSAAQVSTTCETQSAPAKTTAANRATKHAVLQFNLHSADTVANSGANQSQAVVPFRVVGDGRPSIPATTGFPHSNGRKPRCQMFPLSVHHNLTKTMAAVFDNRYSTFLGNPHYGIYRLESRMCAGQ